MGQTKKTGKRSGGATSKATPKGGRQGSGEGAKKATKAPVISKGLATQAAVEDARALATTAVAEVEVEAEGVEPEGVEATAEIEAEVAGEGADSEPVEATAEAPPTGAKATSVIAPPETQAPVVEATAPVVDDPITRAVAAAKAKGMSGAKVKLITTTKIAEFILAQIAEPEFLLLTQGQIKNTSAEVPPDVAKARAEAAAQEKLAEAKKLAQENRDKAQIAAAATAATRATELAALIEAEAEAAQARCDAHGLTFSPTMRSELATTIVVDPTLLGSLAARTFTTRKSAAVAAWREKLRVHMITARFNQLKATTAPPKEGPQPKGENLATLSKATLEALYKAAKADPTKDVAAFEASGDGSLVAQREPTIDQWVNHLGLEYYPAMVSAGSLDGMGIHVTASQGTSFGTTLPVIRKHTSTQIMKMLFEDGVPEMARVHVSLETPVIEGVGFKNPHRYWGKAQAVLNYSHGGQSYPRYDTRKYTAAKIDTALKDAMTALKNSVEAKVVDAMDKDGAI